MPLHYTSRHRRWTHVDRDTLLRLARGGMVTRGIASQLGRSALAVRIMASRLKIALRSPVGRPPTRLLAPSVTQGVAAMMPQRRGAHPLSHLMDAAEAWIGRQVTVRRAQLAGLPGVGVAIRRPALVFSLGGA